MESHVESGVSRVTRSLRKRLTSVDSNQSSSRSGTPVAVTKLAAVSETVVESPRRATRRNSVSTPSDTPVRSTRGTVARGETPEPITPARRTVRRRSLSISKDDEPTASVKSTIKQKIFDALPEEEDAERQDFKVLVRVPKLKTEPISPATLHDEKENTPIITVDDVKTPEQVMHLNKNRSSSKTTLRTELLEKSSPMNKSVEKKPTNNIAVKETSIMQKTPVSTGKKPEITHTPSENNLESKKDTPGSSAKTQSIKTDIVEESPEPKKRLSTMKTPEVSANIQHKMEKDDKAMHTEKANEYDVHNDFSQVESKSTVSNTPKLESTRRITRSQSKSPNVNNTSKKDQPDTDVITIISDDEMMDKSPKEADTSKVVKNGEEEPMDVDESMSILVVNSDDENLIDLDQNKEQVNNDKIVEDTEMSPAKTSPETILELEKEESDGTKNLEKNDMPTPVLITSVINLPPVTPNTMENLLESSEETTPTEDKVKSVGFGDKDVEKEQNIVYPKTPAPHKVRKHFQKVVSPKPEEHDKSDASFESAVGSLKDDEQMDEKIDQDLNNILEEANVSVENSKTPHKSKFLEAIVQSSTPILKSDANVVVSSTVVESTIEPNIITEDPKNIEQVFNRSWNQNIHGSVKPGDKIDKIESVKESLENEKNKAITQNSNSLIEENIKPKVVDLEENQNDKPDVDSPEEEESVEQNDEDEEEELSESENPRKKSKFVDDEAEEVDGYQSGDSMVSEERLEIEENEIHDNGESVGSDDSDDESGEEDDEYEKDSFVTSDTSNSECSMKESNSDTEEITKKVKRKRAAIVSSSDEDEIDQDENFKTEVDSHEDKADNKNNSSKAQAIEPIINSIIVKSPDQSNCLETSKLSEGATKLLGDEEDSESLRDEIIEQKLNASRQKILRNMDKSVRFNKTVREMDVEDTNDSPDQAQKLNSSMKEVVEENVTETASASLTKQMNNNASIEMEPSNAYKSSTRKSLLNSINQDLNNKSISPSDQSSNIDESVAASSGDSDDEATPEPAKESSERDNKMLSRSFGGKILPQTTEKRLYHSFTIDVKVSHLDSANKTQTDEPVCVVKDLKVERDENLEINNSDNEVTTSDVKLLAEPNIVNEEDAKFSSSEEHNDLLDGNEKEQLEKLNHLKVLFNPLQKSKRQSLLLPNSGGQEEQIENKRKGRRSFGQLSSNDFNPSQSFIENIEQRREEHKRLRTKRKRLSKSLSNASDSMTQDLEVQPMRKKSKTVEEESDEEQDMQNVEEVEVEESSEAVEEFKDKEQDISIVEEVVVSPKSPFIKSPKTKQKQDKKNTHGNDSNNNTEKIMQRCDEILEAANRALLDQKIKNKKNQANKPKSKNQKKTSKVDFADNVAPAKVSAVCIKKAVKRLGKEKKAVKVALQAAQDILSKNVKKQETLKQQKQQQSQQSKLKRREKQVNDFIAQSSESSSSSLSSTDSDNDIIPRRQIIKTSAGYVVEDALSPKKPRYIELIRISTGIVRVEPASPPSKGFREEPISPCNFYPAGQGQTSGRRKHVGGTNEWKEWQVIKEIPECKAESSASQHRKDRKRSRLACLQATEDELNFKRQKLKNKF